MAPATAAPGPAGGTAWRFFYTVSSVPGCGAAEPAGSGRRAGAPYSSDWRSRQRPPSVCQQPRPPNLRGGHSQRRE